MEYTLMMGRLFRMGRVIQIARPKNSTYSDSVLEPARAASDSDRKPCKGDETFQIRFLGIRLPNAANVFMNSQGSV
jgi:hypothetical protein